MYSTSSFAFSVHGGSLYGSLFVLLKAAKLQQQLNISDKLTTNQYAIFYIHIIIIPKLSVYLYWKSLISD